MEAQTDPFDVRMVFFRAGWMKHYQGITADNTISSGGAYVTEHGFGHEIFNFQPFEDRVYGYVQPPGRNNSRWTEAKINLTRLGASAKDKSASGILVVWVPTSRAGGAFMVGWYKNATVFREWQSPPPGAARRYKNTDCGYYVSARAEDAAPLEPDARLFPVPQQKAGGFGQSNIWYADDPERHREFRLSVLDFIQTGHVPKTPLPEGSPAPRQPDPLLRQRVERIAIEKTAEHFTQLGYRVDSVEQDNIGWDLNAVCGKRELKLEVKGLSGSQIVVDLTPNEYAAIQKHRDSYRVCVVIGAFTEPCLAIFAYSPDSGRWEGPDRVGIRIQEIVAARCSAIPSVR